MEEYFESTILSGFLLKRNIKTLGVSVGWEKKWFNLRAERLVYYKSMPSKSNPHGKFFNRDFLDRILMPVLLLCFVFLLVPPYPFFFLINFIKII